MKKSLIVLIIEHIFGRKYWANVINCKGTLKAELSCFIFESKLAAEEHRLSLQGNMSYQWLETVSFRSRKDYSLGQATARGKEVTA